MKIIFCICALLVGLSAEAYDCSNVKPFVPMGQLIVKVTVARYFWSHGRADYEDVCSFSTPINWYDVQGREEEAY
jgi:hypothetical protein